MAQIGMILETENFAYTPGCHPAPPMGWKYSLPLMKKKVSVLIKRDVSLL